MPAKSFTNDEIIDKLISPSLSSLNHKMGLRLVFAKGDGAGGGMEWEVGVSRCKLLCREWINNKILLYSTGNYIQYPVINHSRK